MIYVMPLCLCGESPVFPDNLVTVRWIQALKSATSADNLQPFFKVMKSSFFCSHSRFMNFAKSYWSARKRTGQQ